MTAPRRGAESPPAAPSTPPTAAELETFRPFVLRALSGNGVPPCDRPDVAQDVLIIAVLAVRAGRCHLPPDRVRCQAIQAWLYGITWRRAWHYRRRLYLRHEVLSGLDPAPGIGVDPRARIEARSDVLAIRHLGRRDRQILIAHGEGAELAEIGAAHGMVLTTTWRHVRYARARLAAIVGREGGQ